MLLEQDGEICRAIVNTLIRLLPDAAETDRAALRKALDRWRVKQVFAAEGE